ncbi:uncharacterized protein AAGF69_007838 isoform 1-T1 [Amazona ochrocephala]
MNLQSNKEHLLWKKGAVPENTTACSINRKMRIQGVTETSFMLMTVRDEGSRRVEKGLPPQMVLLHIILLGPLWRCSVHKAHQVCWISCSVEIFLHFLNIYVNNLDLQMNCIIRRNVLVLIKAVTEGDQPFTAAPSVFILLESGRKSFELSQIWRSKSEDLLTESTFVTQDNNAPWHP